MGNQVERAVSTRIAAWMEKQARQYAGKRCPCNFHQPKAPKALLREKD